MGKADLGKVQEASALNHLVQDLIDISRALLEPGTFAGIGLPRGTHDADALAVDSFLGGLY